MVLLASLWVLVFPASVLAVPGIERRAVEGPQRDWTCDGRAPKTQELFCSCTHKYTADGKMVTFSQAYIKSSMDQAATMRSDAVSVAENRPLLKGMLPEWELQSQRQANKGKECFLWAGTFV